MRVRVPPGPTTVRQGIGLSLAVDVVTARKRNASAPTEAQFSALLPTLNSFTPPLQPSMLDGHFYLVMRATAIICS